MTFLTPRPCWPCSRPRPPHRSPASAPVAAPASKWVTKEGDVTIRDFKFRSGEIMPAVRLHYSTLGTPHRGANGEIDNAVMVLHGTGGSGKQFLQPQFADELYGPGQPLDIKRYYIILPDNVGHGGSSKPSDGLRMKFPQYDYADMVELQHRMLTEGLGIKKLRLIMGTSDGCAYGFIWGETYPDFAQALMPMACQPVEIAGQNRMWRQLMIDAIKADPAWMGGEVRRASRCEGGCAPHPRCPLVAGGAPLNLQEKTIRPAMPPQPMRANASSSDMASRDANDMLYQFESSRT